MFDDFNYSKYYKAKMMSEMAYINKMFIDGKWTFAESGAALDVIDPSTEAVFHRIPAAAAVDVDRAVKAARLAFDQGPWPKMSGCERAVYLRGIANLIRSRKLDLARIEVMDNGKPLPEAEWDIGDAAGCFDYYAGLAEQLDDNPSELIALPDERFSSEAVLEPVGVVGAIVPWNYPLLMAAWKVAPALAAGCSVVLKPSELTSLTALELAAIADQVKLPRGVLNIVTGLGHEAGQALIDHPMVDKLAFTGSVPTGSRVMAAAARDIKRVSLELGGKSPFIICEDADLEKAVEWIMFGIFWNQGQVCSATSRVLVQESIYPQLLARLVEETRKITIGNGLESGVLLGPLVSAGQFDKVLSAIEKGVADGARLMTGGKRASGFPRGYFVQPTVLADVPLESAAWKEEIFGPVVCLRSYASEDEAIRLANDSEFGLAAAVMSQDDARASRIARKLRAGIVWINCSQPTFTEAPWGGFKKSGIGRELGRWGLANYLETKQITRYHSEQAWGWYIK